MDQNKHRFMRPNAALSFMLSAGLVCGPYDFQCPDIVDYGYYSVDALGLEELGLDKKIKKIVKPIQDMNSKEGRRAMAIKSMQFLRELNSLCGTKHTVDEGIYQSAVTLQKNGMKVDQKKFAYMQNLLNDAQRSLGIGSDYEMKKDFGNIDQMCDEEIHGYLMLICGCLMCILPCNFALAVGGGLVAFGLQQVSYYASKEKTK